LLREGVQTVALDVEMLRAPSAPYQGKPKIISGFNLGRLVAQLHDQSQELFSRWIAHVQTSLPDLDSIRSVLRPEDKTRYLMLRYSNGVEVPSWAVSDGTLRLLALTILAYLPEFKGIYLVEEPENGVHPTALETIYQSLSSVYDGQVLLTSHSPVLLSLPKPEQLLCFQKSPDGIEIIPGDKLPALRDWKGEVSLSDLFAAGVLG
jgi:predicted ATPase